MAVPTVPEDAVNTLVCVFGPKLYPDALSQDIAWPKVFTAMMEKLAAEIHDTNGIDTTDIRILCCLSFFFQTQRAFHNFASDIKTRPWSPSGTSAKLAEIYNNKWNCLETGGWISGRFRGILVSPHTLALNKYLRLKIRKMSSLKSRTNLKNYSGDRSTSTRPTLRFGLALP